MSDVFVSYSRADNALAEALCSFFDTATVPEQPDKNLDYWIDRSDIEYSSHWLDRIYKGIQEANNVLIIVSDAYLGSQICNEEYRYATALNKPIITVLASKTSPDGFQAIQTVRQQQGDWNRLPLSTALETYNSLNSINHIDAGRLGHDGAARAAVTAMFQDIAHKDEQNRLLNRTLEWEAREREAGFLIGQLLTDAELWRDRAVGAQKKIDPRILDFIRASSDERTRLDALERERQQRELELERDKVTNEKRAGRFLRGLLGGAVLFLVVALGLSAFAFDQRGQAIFSEGIANTQSVRADANAANALRSADESLRVALASSAQRLAGIGNYDLALALAIEAVSGENPPQEAINALSELVGAPGSRRIYTAPNFADIRGFNDAVSTLQSSEGVLESLGGLQGNLPPSAATSAAEVAQDLATIQASLSVSNPVFDFILSDGIKTILQPHEGELVGITDDYVIAWDMTTGQQKWLYRTPSPSVDDYTYDALALDSDGETLIFSERLVPSNTDLELISLSGEGSTGTDEPHYWLIWLDAQTGAQKQRVEIDQDVQFLQVIPNGGPMIAAVVEEGLGIWDGNRFEIFAPLENDDPIEALAVSPDGRLAVTLGITSGVMVWDLETRELAKRLPYQTELAFGAAFSPDGQYLATAWRGSTVILWRTQDWSIQWQTSAGTSSSDTGSLINGSAVAFSAHGQHLAVGNSVGAVQLLDTATGAVQTTLIGHKSTIKALLFSPDDSTLFSSDESLEIHQWDIVPQFVGLNRILLPASQNQGNDLALHPDGNSLASVVGDTLYLWMLEGDAAPLQDAGQTDLLHVVYSPNGQFLYTSGLGGGSLIRRDGQTGAWIEVFKDTRGIVGSLDISPDGSQFVLIEDESTALGEGDVTLVGTGRASAITIRDAQTFEEQVAFDLTGLAFNDYPNTVRYASDGQTIWVGSFDGSLYRFDSTTAQHLNTLTSGHTRQVNSIDFSADGQRALTASTDHSVGLWDADSGLLLTKLEEHTGAVNSARFSPDGRYGVTASLDGTLIIWSFETNAPTVIRRISADDGVVDALFTADNRTVIYTTLSGQVQEQEIFPTLTQLIDWIYANRAVYTLSCDERVTYRLPACGVDAAVPTSIFDPGRITPTAPPLPTVTADPELITPTTTPVFVSPLHLVYGVLWSPDQRLMSRSADGTVRVWDVNTGRQQLIFPGHTDDLVWAQWSPDGSKILSLTFDHNARVWDARGGALIAELRGHDTVVNDGVWSPDGQRVVTGGLDGIAIVWDATTGERLHTLSGHDGEIWRVEWSPDGRHIATGSLDDTAILWDAETGEMLHRLEDHDGQIITLPFSPDGRKLVTTSSDETAIVWDVETGEALTELQGHTNWVVGPGWSPDGSRIVTGSLDGELIIWDAESGEDLHHVEREAGVIVGRWSPDGQHLSITSFEGVLQVIDTTDYALVFEHAFPGASLYPSQWSPDGTMLAVGDSLGSFHLFNAVSGDLLRTLPDAASLAVSPTPDFTLTTATPTPPVSPSPTFTATPEPPVLMLGWNEAELPIGRTAIWQLNVEAGDAVTLFTEADWSNELRILDSSGQLVKDSLLATNSLFEDNRRIERWLVPASGTYWVEFRSTNDDRGGEYRLLLESYYQSTPTMTPEPQRANMAEIGRNQGDLEYDQADAWLLELNAGETVSLTTSANWDTTLLVFAPDGTLAAENDDTENNLNAAILAFTAPTQGVYRIEVRSWNNRHAGTYTLTIERP